MLPEVTTGCSVRLVFPATDLSVRSAVRQLISEMPVSALDEDTRSTAEIVLAEALNNIVEHAYAGAEGEIDLRLLREPASLAVEIVDFGRAMPQEKLPQASLPDCDALPEGGFGWFLIHTLSKDLTYVRSGPANVLRFKLAIAQDRRVSG
jgi:serine/threonine-protein kinase RsbW